MDPRSGHLVGLLPEQELPEGYVEIPDLRGEAERTLAGRREARVDLGGGTPLSQFARDRRRQRANVRRKSRARRKRAR